MDYFESVVAQYLQRDRGSFISTEFFLTHKEKQTDPGPPEWLVDILNVNMRERRVYLCEISYARPLQALEKRVREWAEHWPKVVETVRRHSSVPTEWPINVSLFVPSKYVEGLKTKLPAFPDHVPTITALEETLPWKYNRWKRIWVDEALTDTVIG